MRGFTFWRQHPPEAAGLTYQELVEAATEVFDAAAKKMVPDSVAIIGAVRQAYVQLKEGDEPLAETVRQLILCGFFPRAVWSDSTAAKSVG